MIKRLLISFFSAVFIISIAAVIILYGRGYRYDPQSKKVSPTGILSVSSYPEKASVYLDDKLTSATNASISLPPAWYRVRISKEGYQHWEKKVRVQGEVVSTIDALLIPNNPSLKAVTATGIFAPQLSPSMTKVAYFITNSDTDPVSGKTKNGLWIMELIQGPLGNKPAPKQVFIADRAYNLDQAKIYWSTAEKEIILSFIDPKSKTSLPYLAFLISLENGSKTTPINITSRLNSILGEWQQDFIKEENLKLQSLPPQLSLLLSQNTSRIRFSPDDNKILYQATSSAQLAPLINPPLIGTNPTEEVRKIEPQKYYVYDLKEDKNYYLFPAENKSDEVSSPIWYSDSQHLLIVEKDKIYILDYDGLNKRSVYSGPFIDNLVIPWPAGEKIIILTNFNQPGPLADLYEVDLR
ncbi:hypothetical protein A3D78_04240 [Candidatus Gottesmanbacteria bacterium RIFCSPHIGHO2_02_FULL_39_14]|uniref:PEGA domain-containing protein n=2 Tax=Candidatus Gottesmaniibacteriota TaxID=1752720 RepID=A0A1F6A0D6_9BACT|nr:MAG: hypothetical protein A3D78_04240 [Candidatus Gottesmanbacteria bacterium RIFCSPHIGHO2_02_FULL_39_14]OGG32392.1 MAG: hypothetical protein A3I51_04540 [Candidatus Gottesmanbacteria bacterium RIFCSPLOWO2_02_FULL_38_8]